jgi:DNA-directed RNA polymerase specialized sigma24 family protein
VVGAAGGWRRGLLRYWLDLTEAEMADALGVSRGTVKSHVSRGLDALAALLEETR